MKLDEWIELYEKKTKEKFKPHSGFKLFYLPDRGFCEYKIDTDADMVMVYQLSGDGKFWHDFAMLLAELTHCHHVGTFCIRDNIKAYIRFWGYEIEKEELLSDGLCRYHCKHKITGKAGLASPAWTKEDGTVSYFITRDI